MSHSQKRTIRFTCKPSSAMFLRNKAVLFRVSSATVPSSWRRWCLSADRRWIWDLGAFLGFLQGSYPAARQREERGHLFICSLATSHISLFHGTSLKPKHENWLLSRQSYQNDAPSNRLVNKGGLGWWKPLFQGHEVIRRSRTAWRGAYKPLTVLRKSIAAPCAPPASV